MLERVRVDCPNCKQVLRVPMGREGVIKCPRCDYSWVANTKVSCEGNNPAYESPHAAKIQITSMIEPAIIGSAGIFLSFLSYIIVHTMLSVLYFPLRYAAQLPWKSIPSGALNDDVGLAGRILTDLSLITLHLLVTMILSKKIVQKVVGIVPKDVPEIMYFALLIAIYGFQFVGFTKEPSIEKLAIDGIYAAFGLAVLLMVIVNRVLRRKTTVMMIVSTSTSLLGGLMAVGSMFAWISIHLFTVYVAHSAEGFASAFATFGSPIISEIYWMWRVWDAGSAMFGVFVGFIGAAFVIGTLGQASLTVAASAMKGSAASP